MPSIDRPEPGYFRRRLVRGAQWLYRLAKSQRDADEAAKIVAKIMTGIYR